MAFDIAGLVLHLSKEAGTVGCGGHKIYSDLWLCLWLDFEFDMLSNASCLQLWPERTGSAIMVAGRRLTITAIAKGKLLRLKNFSCNVRI